MQKYYETYYNLEMSILSCLLLKPELMQQTKLKDEHFKKHKRLFKFMKAFYEKFGNFDLNLMYSVTKNKYQLLMYIEMLLKVEPIPEHIKFYEEELINLYNQNEKDVWITDKIYDVAMGLWTRNITTEDFKMRIDEIYNNADKLFEEKSENE